MKELKTTKLKAHGYPVPESLQILGVDLCQDCGAHKSVDNSICYGCGFENDNKYIHETLLCGKYQIAGVKMIGELHLVKHISHYKNQKSLYHVMKGGYSLCGLSVHKRNKFDLIGRMTFSVIPTFYKNPCSICLSKLETEDN